MISQTTEPGILLSGTFKQGSPTLKSELAAFEQRLTELQKKLKLGGFLSASKTVNGVTTVKVIAAQMRPPPVEKASNSKGATSGGWGAGKTAKAVTADLKAELGWSKKK